MDDDKKIIGNLKINVTLGSFKVELEGQSDVVISQFNEIKKNGLGQVVDQLIPLVNKRGESALISGNTDTGLSESKVLPTLADSDSISLNGLALKRLPSTEPEWITIYGFYTIHQIHKDVFTREDIIERYKDSKRWTRANSKNLSQSIINTTKRGWIDLINEKDFVVTDSGDKKVQEILARTNGTPRVVKKRKTPNQTKVLQIDPDKNAKP